MDGISILLDARRRTIWNALRSVGQHSRLKMISIAILGGAIWIGLYLFPYFGFHWIYELLRERTIADMLISLFFFLLAIMLVFSNSVIAYTALFRSPEAVFLNACPVRPGTLFLYKLVESLAFSSWAFFLLGVPIMLAYGVHKVAPWYYYPSILLFFASFVLIPASLGALIALLVSAFIRPWMRRVLAWAGTLFALAVLIYVPVYVHSERPVASIFEATALVRRVSFSHSVYWPSAWVSRGLALCAGTPGSEGLPDAPYYLGLLLSNSLFITLLAYLFAARSYPRAWDRAQSSGSRTGFKALARRLADCAPRSPMWNLILKDLKTFVRDPVQWTQCAVLFGLLGLYILNLRNLRYPAGQPIWRNLTTFLNLASICLVLATLTTRFVFPMLSLEGRRFWLLGLVPVTRRYVLWAKFLFSFVASIAVTEILMFVSDLMLGEPPGMMLLHMVTVVLISLGLSGLAVGLSALYPNLREPSPAKIVSGFGGTLNLILSLLFVSLAVAAEALPLHLWVNGAISHHTMTLGLCAAVAFIVLLTALTFALPMWLGSRALARMEF